MYTKYVIIYVICCIERLLLPAFDSVVAVAVAAILLLSHC